MHRQRWMQFHGPSRGVPVTHWSFETAVIQSLGFGDSDSLYADFSVGGRWLFARRFLVIHLRGVSIFTFGCILSILLL